jgi:hypothetical protein
MPIKDRISGILVELSNLKASQEKLQFLQALADSFPNAELAVDSVDGSIVGICWADQVMITLNEENELGVSDFSGGAQDFKFFSWEQNAEVLVSLKNLIK